MKYIFILGRNPELSKAEIFSYLKKEEIKFEVIENVDDYLILEFKKVFSMIEFIGGTIAIGEVICKLNLDNYKQTLDSFEIYEGYKNKLIYCLWKFDQSLGDKVSGYLKKRFKEEKLKASEKPLTGILEKQNSEKLKISSGLIDAEFFVGGNFFGKIVEKNDYKKIELRDMKKPERRESLAISPRLAKIMINLSEVKKGETLLDPFCGIGVILSETLIQGVNVIGVDKNKKAIVGAEKNLSWIGKEKNFKLVCADSKKVKISSADVLVTEPWLGEIKKIAFSESDAKVFLNNYEKLMVKVLVNMKNSVKGKFVFTAPYVKLKNKKRKSCDVEKIIENSKLKLIGRFQEFRQNQVVGREIVVAGK